MIVMKTSLAVKTQSVQKRSPVTRLPIQKQPSSGMQHYRKHKATTSVINRMWLPEAQKLAETNMSSHMRRDSTDSAVRRPSLLDSNKKKAL